LAYFGQCVPLFWVSGGDQTDAKEAEFAVIKGETAGASPQRQFTQEDAPQ
jgi:hypothetical protein